MRTVISQTQLDIVFESYQSNFIKIPERQTRGLSSKIHIKSSKSRVSGNFAKFLLNGENKERMVEIIFSTLPEKKTKVLNYLKINQLIISKQNLCKSITLSTVRIIESLSSNLITEADNIVTL